MYQIQTVMTPTHSRSLQVLLVRLLVSENTTVPSRYSIDWIEKKTVIHHNSQLVNNVKFTFDRLFLDS